jgi:hypothetical protein
MKDGDGCRSESPPCPRNGLYYMHGIDLVHGKSHTACRRLCTKIIVAPLASLVLPSCRPLADGAPFKHLRREYKGTYTSLPEARAEYASKTKAAARRQARACACTPCRVPPVHYTCTCVLQTTFTYLHVHLHTLLCAPAHTVCVHYVCTCTCTCTYCVCTCTCTFTVTVTFTFTYLYT